MIVVLVLVVLTISSITSSAAEVLIGSMLVAITIGLTFGCLLYVSKREAEGLS